MYWSINHAYVWHPIRIKERVGEREPGSGGCELTTVGPQHVDHSPRCAHNDLGSSFQLSNLDTTGARWVREHQMITGSTSSVILRLMFAQIHQIHCYHVMDVLRNIVQYELWRRLLASRLCLPVHWCPCLHRHTPPWVPVVWRTSYIPWWSAEPTLWSESWSQLQQEKISGMRLTVSSIFYYFGHKIWGRHHFHIYKVMLSCSVNVDGGK